MPYPPSTSPSQRFRIEQWAPLLRTAGIQVDLRPFADRRLMEMLHQPGRPGLKALALGQAFVRRSVDLASVGDCDAVVVHRAASLVGPALFERILSLRRPLIFDFDDAIFLMHTTSANERFGWLKFSGKTAAICRRSAHVVVGNEYLASYARRHNPRVTVIPSSVDTDRYAPKPQPRGMRPVIGWMGSFTSQTHLELFAPLLRQLAQRRTVEIRIVSDRRPSLEGVPFVWRPWSRETELEELRGFDIGIMPMPDDAWSQGKCAMKALLYMAVGVPPVCSAVGANREVIRDGENGFLATSLDEWLVRLEMLIDDDKLRGRLGEAGRETVEAKYSMHRCARLFGDVLREVIDESRRNCHRAVNRNGRA